MAASGYPAYDNGSNPNLPAPKSGKEAWNDIPDHGTPPAPQTPAYQNYPSYQQNVPPTTFNVEQGKANPYVMGAPAPVQQPVAPQGYTDNSDWILFLIGWIFPLCWFAGAFRPLCRRPRFPQPMNKGFWIGNILGSLAWIGIIIAIAVVVSNHHNEQCYYYNSYSGYGYYADC